jgi:hypothetical protein
VFPYGSLCAAVGMMRISMVLVMLAAHLNAEIERQTEADPVVEPKSRGGP